jgi:predicted DsbA family dithiol-disulfide isomerase
LFEKQALLNDDTIQSIAKHLALDITKFDQDLHSKDIKAMVDRDLRKGRQLGISAKPTVFINGKYLKRIRLGDISEMIAAELN